MSVVSQQAWKKAQYLIALEYLENKGYIIEDVLISENKYLMPLFSLWKLTLANKSALWVVGGDLPFDHANAEVALKARDAVRHFSLKWQLQAENLLAARVEKQNKLAHRLNSQAKILFQMFNDETLW